MGSPIVALGGGGGRMPDSISMMPVSDHDGHPCPKPVELWRRLIDRYCEPSGTVLDCFLGQGTTAEAAIMECREWIAFELDPGYCAIAERRIAEARAQPRLFDAERTTSTTGDLFAEETVTA